MRKIIGKWDYNSATACNIFETSSTKMIEDKENDVWKFEKTVDY